MIPKFRAWDKENDRMIYPSNNDVYFNLTDDGISIEDLALEPYDGVFPLLDSVLMQSTGLNDKNGVEIFEGDVVKVNEDAGYSYITNVYWGGSDNYPAFDLNVEHIPTEWFYESNILSAIASSGESETIEIIGNIYENPELLNLR